MNTLRIDDKWSVEYDPTSNDRPLAVLRHGAQMTKSPATWTNDVHAMFYALLEARQVRNETAEADRPLEPQTEGTHIHAALLAQDDALPELEIVPAKRKLPGAVSIIRECLTNKEWGSGLVESDLPPEFKSERLNAEEMEELRVLGQRTGGLIEFNPGKRKPMDSAGDLIRNYPDLATDLIRNYPDLATDLAADDEFTARFLKEVRKRGIPHFDPANPSMVIRTNNDFPTVAKTLVEHDEFTAAFLNALADRVHATNVAAGWWSNIDTGESTLHTRNVPEMLMLIVSEISEALEAVRKNLMDTHLPHRAGLIVELADAVIRILDLAGSRMAIERQTHDLVCRNEYIEGRPDVPADDYCHPFGTVLVEKLDHNRNREDHKIENRRGPNGKRI